MTLLERALCLFSPTQKSTNDFELLDVADIINSISSTSNDWNMAAVLLAADHEQSPGKRITLVCYPANTVGHTVDFPAKTTTEWNALALALLEKTRRSGEVSSKHFVPEDAA